MTAESEIKKAIKAYVDSVGGYWSAVTGGAYSKPGDPDLIVCFHGRFIGIEAKTPVGCQSPIQKRRQKEILAAGGIYLLARSVEDVMDVLEQIGSEQDQDV